MSGKASELVLMRALRRPRDEAQLTQLLNAVASVDGVARQLAGVLMSAAPNQGQVPYPLPARVRCRAEQTLASVAGGSHGRVDLRFDDEGGEFTLLVELKLHSGYGHDQVGRYGRALEELPEGRRSGLVAITRNVPGVGEPDAHTERWLGSIRWSQIVSDLRDLAVGPQLASQWLALLDVIEEQGDFGVGELDENEVRAWAVYVDTRKKLEALIEDLAPKALELVVRELSTRPAWAGSDMQTIAALLTRGREKKRAFPTQKTVEARIAIPAADGLERLRFQFLGGFDDPLFTVQAMRPGARSLLRESVAGAEKFRQAVASLRPEFDTDERTYVACVHGPNQWLSGSAKEPVGNRLLALIEEDVKALAASGILDPDSGFAADLGAPTADEDPVEEC